ncbi:hypothetical protein ANN_10107 [Periplaneta americana]|uniref:Uncharacterized protein n=1 Tax=Periplaneta americana TaxID=6978 RepID=A0ABQ8TRW6_PERAM|nr:hypothetical protein ANN_10107 [Periplaneta americana]
MPTRANITGGRTTRALAKSHTIITEENIVAADNLIRADLRRTVDEMAQNLNIMEARHITVPKQFRNFTTVGKVMLMLFFQSVCLLRCHFMERGESVTSARYSEILRTELRRVVKNKRRGRLHEDVIMLHDITRLHTVRHTMDTIRDLR